jgi:hypothetical protein
MERAMDAWVYKLKAAYEAGYYKTEAEEADQIAFPWQNKTCKNCPFWSNSICQVYAEYRSSTAHTCSYYDPCHRQEAQNIIQERQWQGFRRWWEWFNDRGATR